MKLITLIPLLTTLVAGWAQAAQAVLIDDAMIIRPERLVQHAYQLQAAAPRRIVWADYPTGLKMADAPVRMTGRAPGSKRHIAGVSSDRTETVRSDDALHREREHYFQAKRLGKCSS